MEDSRSALRVLPVRQVDMVRDLWLELAEHHWRHAQRIASLASPVTPAVSWSMRRAQYESWASEPGWLLLGSELDGRLVGYAASRVVPVASSWDFGERISVMAENSDAVRFYEGLGTVEHSRVYYYPA